MTRITANAKYARISVFIRFECWEASYLRVRQMGSIALPLYYRRSFELLLIEVSLLKLVVTNGSYGSLLS
jgi:hypothetical protein